jgi:hypothetical protein
MSGANNISILLGILNIMGLFYFGVLRLSRIESRVEVLWTFQLRRGIVEGVNDGLLKNQSPLAVTQTLKDRYRLIFATVKDYYDREGKTLTDTDLAIGIEKLFWPSIKEMCAKENIFDGACLVVLLNYVRPDSTLFTEWEELHVEDDTKKEE